MLQGNFVKIFNSTEIFKKFFVLKFELILIIGSNNVLTEGARKEYIAGAALDRAGLDNRLTDGGEVVNLSQQVCTLFPL
jgi:hypothetical protein